MTPPAGDTGAATPGADQAGGADASFGPEASAAGGGETVAMTAPNVIGDLISSSFLRVRFGATQVGALPLQVRAAFKIAENESPKPCDRIFFNLNYFNEVNTNLVQPGATPRPDVYREVFGFEKTFLGGDASVGVRVPVLQMGGDGGFNIDSWGDISFILKYAIINNCCTGNVLSTGVVITAPTGGSLANSAFFPDKIHTTYYQPYIGWIYNGCDWYVQGFSSCLIPSDHNDATVLFNDVALGYWLYVAPDCRFRSSNAFAEKGCSGCWHDPTQNAFSDGGYVPCCCGHPFISAIIPSVEAHAVTPLDHRNVNLTDDVFSVDSLVMTGGVHIQFLNTADLMVGVATPVTGPRPYQVEAICQLNVKF
jgi:hypothetical protein